MARYNIHQLDKKEKEQLLDNLFEAIKHLKSKQDIVDFFRDLLTESEAIMLARRVQIAQMILDNKSFYDIKTELGASFDTINSVKRFVEYGSDGYKKVIERLAQK